MLVTGRSLSRRTRSMEIKVEKQEESEHTLINEVGLLHQSSVHPSQIHILNEDS